MKWLTLLSALLAVVACAGVSSPPSSSSASGDIPPLAHPSAPGETTPPPANVAAAMSLKDSGLLPEWIDDTADPCNDFFAYACGNFLKTAQIPPDRVSWGTNEILIQENESFLRAVLEKAAKDPGSDALQKKIGDYYAACMDEAAIDKAGTAPLDALLAVIARVSDGKSAAQAVIELQAIGISPFFGVTPSQDFVDATQVIASVDQAGLGLPDRSYYLESKGNMNDVRAAYRAHIARTFVLLGKKPAEAESVMTDVLRVETAIAKVQQDKVTRRDPHKLYHRIERKGLEKVAPSFPWGRLFDRLDIGGVTALTANDPKYFTAVAGIIAHEKPAALRAYLTWTLISAVAPDLSRPFVDEQFAFTKVLTGQKELPPRWRRCVRRVDGDLGQLLAQSYVAQRFAGDSKPRAVDLTKAVLAAMVVELDELPWMDAATRASAQQKLAKMEYLVGYPDSWRVYDFDVTRQSHAANALAASRFELHRQLAKIGRPVDRSDWDMTPPTVNASYDSSLNHLQLPAGQLQPPFFGASFHPAVNFGATGGGTIGHEMTHAFDDEGSQFDADGNLKDWWSKPTEDKFKAAAQCVIDQYGQYEAVPGIKLNGRLTAGENIADIGGVKLAYKAYQAWKAKQQTKPPASVEGKSDAQLYFLSYAQSWCEKLTPEILQVHANSNPHSPPRWRVNGVVVDEPAFAEAFQCKLGSPMRPEQSCSVW